MIDPAAPSSTPYVLPDTTWRRGAGEPEAHAFSIAPGWSRSVCRARAWSVALLVDWNAPRCHECTDLVEGRIPEGELRAMGGDR